MAVNPESLIAFRKIAEESVVDMADGPLKVKAFEVILSQLLAGADSSGAEAHIVAGRSEKSSKVMTKTKSPTSLQAGSEPKTLPARILSLRDDGFFNQEQSLGRIKDALKLRGWVYPITSLSGGVQGLVQKRELRRSVIADGKVKKYGYVRP